MKESPCTLDTEQRRVVEQAVSEHCRVRGWELYVVNCRTNHVHVVVTADRAPKEVRNQLKAFCTRKLKQLQRSRESGRIDQRRNWWTEGGSQRFINDEAGLEAAINYVREGQDEPWRNRFSLTLP
jgi:REP element-mobilizing transposase RayT